MITFVRIGGQNANAEALAVDSRTTLKAEIRICTFRQFRFVGANDPNLVFYNFPRIISLARSPISASLASAMLQPIFQADVKRRLAKPFQPELQVLR